MPTGAIVAESSRQFPDERARKNARASLPYAPGNPIVAVTHGKGGGDAAFSKLNNARAGLLCSVCKSALE